MHPFMENLDRYSDEQIKNKLNELTSKYWKSSDPNIQSQIILAIDTFNLELQTRQNKPTNDIEIKDIDNLINIS